MRHARYSPGVLHFSSLASLGETGSGPLLHGCFIDGSKAFDLVDHSLLFQKLIDRGLPLLNCSLPVIMVQHVQVAYKGALFILNLYI